MDSVVTDVFQGQFYNSVKCQTCYHNHISFDTFLSVTLALPKSSTRLTHYTSLKDCLQEFVKEEYIDKREGYRCEKCKVPVSIRKQTVIWRLPPVVVIHLKRFHCSTWKKEKLDTVIDFALRNLDLRPYCGQSGTCSKQKSR